MSRTLKQEIFDEEEQEVCYVAQEKRSYRVTSAENSVQEQQLCFGELFCMVMQVLDSIMVLMNKN